MAIDYRNQTIARMAYAVAQSDGGVQSVEREALQAYLSEHPETFSDDDQADILSYFDDFAFQLGRPVLDDWRLKSLGMYLYNHDTRPVLELIERIAQAYDGVVPAEAALLERIQAHLAQARAGQA